MKYLCLVYLDEKRLDELPDEDCVAYDTQIRNSGCCLASEALQSAQSATTVRMRNGKLSITDGPFAETKELVAGYTIINVKSREEAIELTRRFPNPSVEGKDGEIEVREFFELEDFGPSEAVERFREMGMGGNKSADPKAVRH